MMMCEFRSARDFKMTGRRPTARGEDFDVCDSEYADDTAIPFATREIAEERSPQLFSHFERFDMQIHRRAAGSSKASKTEMLYVAAPASCYANPDTYDGADFSDFVFPNGDSYHVVDFFCYLGSIIARDCSDTRDVERRLKLAGMAFGMLSTCVFRSTSITMSAKRAVYERLILAIGLFGSEVWCLTEALWGRLRVFHNQCLRAMCRVTRKHTWDHHISSQELGQRLGIECIEHYVDLRQLRWLGHVARMPWERAPRRMLSCWVQHARPHGAPEMTYGRSIAKAMKRRGIDFDTWPELASDRTAWYSAIGGKAPVHKRMYQPLEAPSHRSRPVSSAPTFIGAGGLATVPQPPPRPPPPSPPPPPPSSRPFPPGFNFLAASLADSPPPATPPRTTRVGRAVRLPARLR